MQARTQRRHHALPLRGAVALLATALTAVVAVSSTQGGSTAITKPEPKFSEAKAFGDLAARGARAAAGDAGDRVPRNQIA